MKRLNLFRVSAILLGLTFLTLTSCDKDNDTNGNGSSDELIGKWTITSSTYEITVNGDNIIQYLMEAMGLTETEAEEFAEFFFSDMGATGTIEFKSDGTYVAISDGETDEGTWVLSSDNKTLTMDKGTEYEAAIAVISLTSTKAVMEFTQTETDDLDEDGTPDTMEIFMHLELSK